MHEKDQPIMEVYYQVFALLFVLLLEFAGRVDDEEEEEAAAAEELAVAIDPNPIDASPVNLEA